MDCFPNLVIGRLKKALPDGTRLSVGRNKADKLPSSELRSPGRQGK